MASSNPQQQPQAQHEVDVPGHHRFTRESLLAHPAFADPHWYHAIEFFPGLFSPGADRGNLAVTRTLLKRCRIEGQTCLDVGTMDGMMTLLMLRRGAKRVLAYDRLCFESNIHLVKEFFALDFDYVCGEPMSALPRIARERGAYPFDMILFSGVLYHMFDPMAGLAYMRGLVRNGGLVLIETASVLDPRPRLHLNATGRFYRATTYWMISLEALDYLCRFMKLAPIGCAHRKGRVEPESGLTICRVGVVCRAVSDFMPSDGDKWMGQVEEAEEDYAEYINWEELASSGRGDLEYVPVTSGLVMRPDTGTVNVYETVMATESIPFDPKEHGRLCLGAKY